MSREAVRHLSTDLRLGELICRVGPPRLEIQRQRGLYEALIRAIAHQQLHGRAAEAILGRFAALFPGDAFSRSGRSAGDGGSGVAGLRLFRVKDRSHPRYLCEGPRWNDPEPSRIGPPQR